MAVLKPFCVRNEPGRVKELIEYALNPEKTQDGTDAVLLFTGGVNCQSDPEAAARAFRTTRESYPARGNRLAYHFIQSFKPGEVDPETAHRIGTEWAAGLFGERFEAVVGTHLDKDHVHNHIVVNAVSFADGHKLHYDRDAYVSVFRGFSDKLCVANGLGVIPKKYPGTRTGMSYAEWKATKEGKPTVRAFVAREVEEIVSRSKSMGMFLRLAEDEGYEVKAGKNRKYISVRPPGAKRFVRLTEKSVRGFAYAETAIKERIATRKPAASAKKRKPSPFRKAPRKRFGGFGALPVRRPDFSLRGLRGLYRRYVFMLCGGAKAKKVSLYAESLKLRGLMSRARFLSENGIVTDGDLEKKAASLEKEKTRLFREKARLRKTNAGADAEAELAAKLKKTYADLRLAKRIREESVRLRENLSYVREAAKGESERRENERRKENEH